VFLDNQFAHNRDKQTPHARTTFPIDPGPNPVVRYVDRDGIFNVARIEAWSLCLKHWTNQGRTPAFFAHTESDNDAPDIAKTIYRKVCGNPQINDLNPAQLTLF